MSERRKPRAESSLSKNDAKRVGDLREKIAKFYRANGSNLEAAGLKIHDFRVDGIAGTLIVGPVYNQKKLIHVGDISEEPVGGFTLTAVSDKQPVVITAFLEKRASRGHPNGFPKCLLEKDHITMNVVKNLLPTLSGGLEAKNADIPTLASKDKLTAGEQILMEIVFLILVTTSERKLDQDVFQPDHFLEKYDLMLELQNEKCIKAIYTYYEKASDLGDSERWSALIDQLGKASVRKVHQPNVLDCLTKSGKTQKIIRHFLNVYRCYDKNVYASGLSADIAACRAHCVSKNLPFFVWSKKGGINIEALALEESKRFGTTSMIRSVQETNNNFRNAQTLAANVAATGFEPGKTDISLLQFRNNLKEGGKGGPGKRGGGRAGGKQENANSDEEEKKPMSWEDRATIAGKDYDVSAPKSLAVGGFAVSLRSIADRMNAENLINRYLKISNDNQNFVETDAENADCSLEMNAHPTGSKTRAYYILSKWDPELE